MSHENEGYPEIRMEREGQSVQSWLPIKALQIKIECTAFLARKEYIFQFLNSSGTILTMKYYNDSDSETAASLLFPVPDGLHDSLLVLLFSIVGATVCGYAVDINGRLVKASICPKETARVAFETGVF